MTKLPTPVTVDQMYLAELLKRVDELVARWPESQPRDQLTPLREPKPAITERPLPDDFPGRRQLAVAGIDTVDAVPRDRDALTAISGIGNVTATQILDEVRRIING
jgi:hypothetical protein